LDKARGGSTSPKVGQGRREDKCSYITPQVEAKNNSNHRARQRNASDEEIAGKTYHHANTEKERQAQMELLQE
jgi:hypothetical protein